MKEKRDCEIVQDLLPNYIEKLTNEETNIYIEEHLKECSECQSIYENMKRDVTSDNPKREKREIKYIKKYSEKLKVLKVIILVIIAVFAIDTGRKMIIIAELVDKSSSYVDSNNYHKKVVNYQGTVAILSDIYYKDGKKAEFMGENNEVKMYLADEKVHIYVEPYKTAQISLISQESPIKDNDIESIKINNFFELFIASVFCNIQSEEYNKKNCYVINVYTGGTINGIESGTYIDKETGLVIRKNGTGYSLMPEWNFLQSIEVDFYYFDTVTDDIFIEPDISQYEVTEI